MESNKLTQALNDEDFIATKRIIHEELYEKIAIVLEKIKTDMYAHVFNEAKKAKKTDKEDDGDGLDPVGAEDSDVDNDGDSDESDDYLNNRRKTVGKAIKKKKNGDDEELDEEQDIKITASHADHVKASAAIGSGTARGGKLRGGQSKGGGNYELRFGSIRSAKKFMGKHGFTEPGKG